MEAPGIYVIENNHYAMGTAVERGSALAEELYHRGSVFGIPGEQVDGMDVAAVKAAGERAVARARAGEGPKILEMLTYRYRGHSMSDPAKYRTREEVQDMREHRDPIELCASACWRKAGRAKSELKEIDKEVRACQRGRRVRASRPRARRLPSFTPTWRRPEPAC